jgi:hypothetical protein
MMKAAEARRLEKAIRFAQAFRKLDGLDVPKQLVELEASGELGRELAGLCWTAVAEAVSQASGRTETPPSTSVPQIVKLCDAWLSERVKA